MSDASDGVLGGVIGGTIAVGAFFLYSRGSKVEKIVDARPSSLLSYEIPGSVEGIWNAIRHFEPNKFKLAYEDPHKGLIVLGQNMSPITFHNGIWLMLYLSATPSGNTLLEIGIKSKSYQAPFAINLVRNKIADRLYLALTGKPRPR